MDIDNPEDRKAYQLEDSLFQELEAAEFNEQEARNRILLRTAVLSYVEQLDSAALIDLFEKGFSLYKYAERSYYKHPFFFANFIRNTSRSQLWRMALLSF